MTISLTDFPVDGEEISNSFWYLMDFITVCVIQIGVIIILAPPMLGVALGLAIGGWWIGNIYMAAQISVKREM